MNAWIRALHSLAVASCVVGSSVSATCAQEPGRDADLLACVDAYFAPLVESGIFSGTVLVARDGEVLVETAYGLADIDAGIANAADTAFKIMSVSKAITAVAAMRLVQDGVIALEDPVEKHLPDWPESWQGVTVHDLLDHSSGIPNVMARFYPAINRGHRGLEAWRQTAASLGDVALEAEPGARHRYSNLHFELVGAVIEAASGESYRDVMRKLVLEPAGMKRTGFDDGSRRVGLSVGYFREGGAPTAGEQDMSRIQAAGGFYSTVGDLYRLDRALRGGELLDEATRSKMTQPRSDRFYACGWTTQPVHDKRCLAHSGGANGYVANLLRFPEENACVVVMSNFAFAPVTRLSEDVAGMLFDAEIAAPRTASDAELDAAGGVYGDAAEGLALVRRSGDVLFMFELYPGARGSVSGRPLIPVGEQEFARPFGRGAIRFENDKIFLPQGDATRVLGRSEDATADWVARAGDYVAAETGATASIEASVDGVRLREVSAVEPIELFAVTPEIAIASFNEQGGSLVQVQGEELHWHRYDGVMRLRQR